MTPAEVTAIVVTKGDRDIMPVVGPLGAIFGQLIVWDNSKCTPDEKVYGRFAATAYATKQIIYVQDDDCHVDAAAVVAKYQPGKLVVNMPHDRRPEYAGTGIALIGWGAVFHEQRINFYDYLIKFPSDELFFRECDRVFTWLNRDRTVLIDVPVTHMPWAHGKDRMGGEARHGTDFAEIRRRLAQL